MKGRIFVIVSLAALGVFAIGAAALEVALWIALPAPHMGIPLALAGALGGVVISQGWALACAERIDTVSSTRRGKITSRTFDGMRFKGEGVEKTFKVTVVPRHDGPARVLLTMAIVQFVAGVVLCLTGQVDVISAGMMCLAASWMRSMSRGMWRSVLLRPSGPSGEPAPSQP